MSRKLPRGTFVLVLMLCLLWVGIVPAHAACPRCTPCVSQGHYHVANSEGHLQPHSCCNGIKTSPYDIDQGCAFEMPWRQSFVSYVVLRVEYPSPAALAVLSAEMPLPHQPLWGLTDRGSNLAEAVFGPFYLRNLCLRC